MTQPRDVDVVVLTALSLEHEAVRSYLTETVRHIDGNGTRYEIGGLSGSPCRIALALIGEGNATAASLTGRAIEEFTPTALMFVGVAGGIAYDVALGDVVVATRINAIHGGREDISGFQPRLRGWLLSHGLEQLAREVAQAGRWAESRPGAPPRPNVHFKPLASGDVVLDSRSSPLAKMLAEHYGDAVAIDMESAGFAEAAHRSDFGQAVSIRGISDLADGDKRLSDSYGSQPRAAMNAAAFAMTLAEQICARPLRTRPGRRLLPGTARPCPYRGLAAFRERDAELFFGRAELADELADLVSRRRFVTVVGRSGSGKSSLVHAGLLPRMRGRDWAIAAFRPLPDVPAATVLAGGLLPLLNPGLDRTEVISQRGVLAHAIVSGRLPELAGEVLAATGKSRLLVCVDQFEEFVARDEQAARELADLLVQLSTGAAPTSVVLTLRMETLSIAVSRLGLGEVARNSVFLLSPMQSAQLRSAIEDPVEPTGLMFEPGLVERILESAKDDPEALALMQFALTRLWERQQEGLLTHAAYDGFGGVGGALAAYAEQVWAHDLDDPERIQARRVLVQLVRPDNGDVIRRTARGRELKPDLMPIARRLASTRLVVTGMDADGETTFDLAHAALAVHWQRLRDWLDQERDFRTWQEDLRESIRRAEPLRGPRLGNALRWQREHPDDITRTEREFIGTSRRGHRRRTVAWRSGLAAIATLLLLAGVFAVILQERTDELRQQVRINAARALLSQAREPGLDPDTAALLTVAAFRSGGQDPAVLANLAGEYLRYRSVTRQFNAGVGHILQLQISADRRTIAALGESGVAVWQPDRPRTPPHRFDRRMERIALSPDGRLLAGVTDLGRIEVRQPDGSFKVLDPGGPESNPAKILRFDAGSQRLLAQQPIHGPRVWDLKRGVTIPVAPRLAELVKAKQVFPGGKELISIWFGPGGDSLVVATDDQLAVWRFNTGRSTRLIPLKDVTHATVTPNGLTAITCGPNRTLRRWSLVSLRAQGRPRAAGGVCPRLFDARLDHIGSVIHAGVRQEGGEDHPRGVATLLRTVAGTTARPVIPESTAPGESDAVATTAEHTRLVTAVGSVAMIVDLPPAGFAPVNRLLSTPFHKVVFSEDGRRAITMSGVQELHLWDTTTGQELDHNRNPRRYLPIRFSTDNRTLLTWDVPAKQLVLLAVPSFNVQERLPIRAAPRAELKTEMLLSPFDGICFEPTSASDTVAVYYRGFVSQFDLRSRKQTGSPLKLWPDWDDLNRLRLTTACAVRSGRGEIAINIGKTANTGQIVEVWNMKTGRQVTKLQIRSASRILGLQFSTDGRLLVALTEDGSAETWDVDRGRPVGSLLKVLEPAGFSEIIDVTADQRIIVRNQAKLRVWDLGRQATIADVDVGSNASTAVLTAGRQTLLTWTKSGPTRVPLDPHQWAAHLCRIVGRDVTPAERKAMPPGSPTGRICP